MITDPIARTGACTTTIDRETVEERKAATGERKERAREGEGVLSHAATGAMRRLLSPDGHAFLREVEQLDGE